MAGLVQKAALGALAILAAQAAVAHAGSAGSHSPVAVHSVGTSALFVGKGIERRIDQLMGRTVQQPVGERSRHNGEKHKRGNVFIVNYPRGYAEPGDDGHFVQYVVNRVVRNQGFDLSETFGLDRRPVYLDTVVVDAAPRQGEAYAYVLVDGRKSAIRRITGRHKLVFDLSHIRSGASGGPTIGVAFAGVANLFAIGAEIKRR